MGGKVKLYDDSHWYCKETASVKQLPKNRVDSLRVEAIDLSNTKLIYEGVETLRELVNALCVSSALFLYVV